MADLPIRWKVAKPDQPGPECMWRINRPDLGMVGEGYLFEILYRRVCDYRRANGIPIGLEFQAEVEDILCRQYAHVPGACVCDDPRAPIEPRSLKYGEVLQGTRVMATFLAQGKPTVPREEAERRASICASCPMNVQFSKLCGGLCGELKGLIETIVGNATTSLDGQLNSCFICGCYLSVSVWLPQDIQWNVLSEHQKVQFAQIRNCWKRPENTPTPP